ncbi:MAG: hypothetical protein Kow00108_21180 [Calditrichia bacterium]
MEISNDLIKLMKELLGDDASIFFNQIGNAFDNTLRFNSLKGTIEDQIILMEASGFKLEPIQVFEQAYKVVNAPYAVGKTLSHFLGHIYIQDLSSMIPPLVLDPQPGDIVLDMSAAPGSKTTQIAALMENEGVLIANDADPKRVQTLSYNLERMGAVNTHVINTAGERIGKIYPETFDKILLDPPCSGLGTLHKNPEINNWWTPEYSLNLAERQFYMLRSAVRALKPGGILVYSTCTLTPWENEMVITRALQEFPLTLMPIAALRGLEVEPGLTSFQSHSFHQDMEKTIRLNPVKNQTEGFFIARLQKTESMNSEPFEKQPHTFNWMQDNQSPVKKYVDFISNEFGIDRKLFRNYKFGVGRKINFINKMAAEFPLYFKPARFGLPFGNPMQQGIKLTTEAVHFWGRFMNNHVIDLETLKQVEEFVNRESDIAMEGKPGQKIFRYKNNLLGYGYFNGKKCRSFFPQAEWEFRF